MKCSRTKGTMKYLLLLDEMDDNDLETLTLFAERLALGTALDRRLSKAIAKAVEDARKNTIHHQ